MYELLFKRYAPDAPQDFYELYVERSSDTSRPYCVRQTHHEFDGVQIQPIGQVVDRLKTPEEATDLFTLRRQVLIANGFLGSSAIR